MDRRPIILDADGLAAEITAGDALVAPAFAGDGSRLTGMVAAPETLATGTTLVEDFLGGVMVTGQAGTHGWSFGNTGTNTGAFLVGVADHPGILQRGTGATSGNVAAIHLRTVAPGIMLPVDFDLAWYVRPNNVATNTAIRCGLGDVTATDAPSSGIYIEKATASAIWVGVVKNSTTITRTPTLGTAVASAWVRLRIRRVGSGDVFFSLDGGPELSLGAALVNAAAVAPWAAIHTAEAVTKLLDFDAFEMRLGVTR